MVFTCENQDFLAQTQFMQLIQGNQIYRDPLLYFTVPSYIPSLLMNGSIRMDRKVRASCYWFSQGRTKTSQCKHNLCYSSKGIKYIRTHCCILRSSGIYHPNSLKKYSSIRKIRASCKWF